MAKAKANAITITQARRIRELTQVMPKIRWSDRGTGWYLEHSEKKYYNRSPSAAAEKLITDLRAAADELITDLEIHQDSLAALNQAAEEAELARKAAMFAEEEARLAEEEANRTPLERAEVSWKEALELMSKPDELLNAASYVVLTLVKEIDREDDETVEAALVFVQTEVIDTLLEFDDLPLMEGTLLASAADIIGIALATEDQSSSPS